VKKWSVGRVGFVMGHLESFVERAEDDDELRERLRTFTPQSDLDHVERITLADPSDPALPELVLERLAPFFESGVLIQRGLENDAWAVTDVFGRGTTFHLAHDEQVVASRVVPEIGPLDVRKAPADPVLRAIEFECLLPAKDATAYLFRPMPDVCLVLISRLGPVFAVSHVEAARKLVSDSFLY
jgi:hypothetical protein